MTNSQPNGRVGSQIPVTCNYDPYIASAAPEIIDYAAHCGLFLLEWQKFSLEHGCGLDALQEWSSTRVAEWVPRQNGKGGIIEALELYWMGVEKQDLVIHSAHEHRTSANAYKRLERLFRATPDLHREVRLYRQANGEQGIIFRDGRSLMYSTRSRTAVRGFSTPRLILDEAQELTAEQIAAIMPTVSAMPNWQIWFFGTPPEDPAAWCYNLKDDGEKGVPRLAWFNWGMNLNLDDPDDLEKVYDIETAYRTNPSMGDEIAIKQGRALISEQTVRDEMRPSGLGDKFAQERLGVWKPRAMVAGGVIPMDLWQALTLNANNHAKPGAGGDIVFAAQISTKRNRSCIAGCGSLPDGRVAVFIVEYRSGTEWLAERLAELKTEYNPIAIAVQDKGPTGTLILDLEPLDIKEPEDKEAPERGALAIPWAAEVAVAFGMFVDACTQTRLFHFGDGPLTIAVKNTDTRPLSGATAWEFRGDTDASPLLAATFAYWAYITRKDIVVEDYDVADSFA